MANHRHLQKESLIFIFIYQKILAYTLTSLYNQWANLNKALHQNTHTALINIYMLQKTFIIILSFFFWDFIKSVQNRNGHFLSTTLKKTPTCFVSKIAQNLRTEQKKNISACKHVNFQQYLFYLVGLV